jgi:hypothetical protein
MAGTLGMHQPHNRYEAAEMEARRGGIKADVYSSGRFCEVFGSTLRGILEQIARAVFFE